MEILPQDENQTKLVYVVWLTALDAATATIWQLTGAWMPLVITLLWTAFLFYDLFLYDFIFGAEADVENELEFAEKKWLAGREAEESARLRAEVKAARKELEAIRRETVVLIEEEELDDA